MEQPRFEQQRDGPLITVTVLGVGVLHELPERDDEEGRELDAYLAVDRWFWFLHRGSSPRSNKSCTLTLRRRMWRAARVRCSIVESLGSAVPSLRRSSC